MPSQLQENELQTSHFKCSVPPLTGCSTPVVVEKLVGKLAFTRAANKPQFWIRMVEDLKEGLLCLS